METAEQRKRRLQGNQDADGQLVKRLKGAAAKGALKATGCGHGGRGGGTTTRASNRGMEASKGGGVIRPAAADVDEEFRPEVGEDEEGDEGLMSGEESGEEAR